MPQLDKVTFLSQFFWLCFFYLGFYYFVYKFFLPKMGRILKFRQKKISLSYQGVTALQDENSKVSGSYETVFTKGLSTSKKLFGETSHKSADWIKKTLFDCNKTQLQQMNTTYIHALGENSASEAFALQQSSFSLSKKGFFSLALAKIAAMKATISKINTSSTKISSKASASRSASSSDQKTKPSIKQLGFTEMVKEKKLFPKKKQTKKK